MLQRNRWLPTIFLIPSLYFLGWLIAQPLNIFFGGISSQDISLIGTLITFILFLYFLPGWIKFRWNHSNPLEALGLAGFSRWINLFFFIRGLFISLILLFIIVIILFCANCIQSFSLVSFIDLFHALVLGFGVGLAEEIVFRGWLFGEMKYLLDNRFGLFLQVSIYSISHLRLDMNIIELCFLLFGLFLLGMILTFRRILDGGAIWGSISLHGGLVGGWFLISTGLIQLSIDIPSWLIGPGNSYPNPIGGLAGIITMACILFSQRKAFIRF